MNVIYYPVICDDNRTIELNSNLQAQVFQEDPLWSVIQPDQNKRFYAIKSIMDIMQQSTKQFGCNLIFMRINDLQCQAALTATPPGVQEDYLGHLKNGIQLLNVMKSFNWKNIKNMNVFERIHQENCKQIDNHMYICGLVTNQACRHQGLGKQIFKIINSITSQSQASIYLENSKEINIQFYNSVGLTTIQKYICKNQVEMQTTIYIMSSQTQEKQKSESSENLQIPVKETIIFY